MKHGQCHALIRVCGVCEEATAGGVDGAPGAFCLVRWHLGKGSVVGEDSRDFGYYVAVVPALATITLLLCELGVGWLVLTIDVRIRA